MLISRVIRSGTKLFAGLVLLGLGLIVAVLAYHLSVAGTDAAVHWLFVPTWSRLAGLATAFYLGCLLAASPRLCSQRRQKP